MTFYTLEKSRLVPTEAIEHAVWIDLSAPTREEEKEVEAFPLRSG